VVPVLQVALWWGVVPVLLPVLSRRPGGVRREFRDRGRRGAGGVPAQFRRRGRRRGRIASEVPRAPAEDCL